MACPSAARWHGARWLRMDLEQRGGLPLRGGL